jgi:hypothetical protein
MKKISYFGCSIFIFLFFLSGCLPYHRYIKSEFPQGYEYKVDKKLISTYLKSKAVYDEFSTVAIFDAIWNSDEVHSECIDMQHRGKEKREKKKLLKTRLYENEQWISFYVLADIRNSQKAIMSEQDPQWKIYLQCDDGKRMDVEEIKEIDELSPTITAIFGKQFTDFKNFKTPYLVKFERVKFKDKLKLIFSSPEKECSLKWDLEED